MIVNLDSVPCFPARGRKWGKEAHPADLFPEVSLEQGYGGSLKPDAGHENLNPQPEGTA